MSIKVAIIDDEPLARERIRQMLEDENDIQLIDEWTNGSDAIKGILQTRPDLIFLDIQMPERNGFDVLQSIRNEYFPVTIFVTAYDEHAIRAFEYHALDYLLKPFEKSRFYSALERARAAIHNKKLSGFSEQLSALANHLLFPKKFIDRLVLKTGGRVLFLKVEEIDWIEAAGNYVNIHSGSQTHLLRETMSAMEERLNPGMFIRIHRSTIVNINLIKELRPLFNGEFSVVLADKTHLTMSKIYRDKLPEELRSRI